MSTRAQITSRADREHSCECATSDHSLFGELSSSDLFSRLPREEWELHAGKNPESKRIGVAFGGMRIGVCLMVFMLILIGCTTAEERFLNEQFDLNRISQPQDGAILLALVRANGSVAAVDTGEAPLGPDDPIRIASITKAFTSALV